MVSGRTMLNWCRVKVSFKITGFIEETATEVLVLVIVYANMIPIEE